MFKLIIILWIALVVWTYSKREHRNRLKVRYNKLIKDLKRESNIEVNNIR